MSSGSAVKVGLFAAIIGGLFWVFNTFFGGSETTEKEAQVQTQKKNTTPDAQEYDFYPTSTTGEIVRHKYYTLSYDEKHEQAEWVAYALKRETLNKNWVNRSNNFRPDPFVRKASASDRDYRGSGYDRGHLVPAGDMAFADDAMSETFYMSNMSPQIRNFNGGIWRELEENVRDWARKFKEIYVISGPVLTKGIRDRIGGNQVSVPDQFYKVILDATDPEIKAIAFLIPNEKSVKRLEEYALTINEVEAITNIDFFHNLIEDDWEEELEGTFDIELWPRSEKRYRERVEEWNKR